MAESAQLCGLNCKTKMIRKVMIPEALPSLISGSALTAINLIGYSAMAGAIGGGDLGIYLLRIPAFVRM